MNSLKDVFTYYFRYAHEKEDDSTSAHKHYRAAKYLIDAFVSNNEEYNEYINLIYSLYNQLSLKEDQKQLLNTMGFTT